MAFLETNLSFTATKHRAAFQGGYQLYDRLLKLQIDLNGALRTHLGAICARITLLRVSKGWQHVAQRSELVSFYLNTPARTKYHTVATPFAEFLTDSYLSA